MAQSNLITVTNWRSRQARVIKELVEAFDTSTGHSHDGSDSPSISATGNTLDAAYDQGGAGAGRTITAAAGAVAITVPDTANNGALTLTQNDTTNNPVVLTFSNAGTGNDVTADNWSMTKAGVLSLDSINTVGVIIFTGDTLGTGSPMIGSDNSGDVTVNALTGKQVHLAVDDVDVVDVASTGITVTGNLTVTGTFGISGNWDVGATLTVDELILDTDGAAPAATNVYAVRDNAGDLTLNAVTGKTINLAVAGTDEVTLSATIMDLNANALDNVGYLVLNAATAPAGTEVYLVNDNSGDLTLNALNTKSVRFAVGGTDIVSMSASSLDILADSDKLRLGTGNDAALYYDGTDLVIDPAEVGTGDVKINGGGIYFAADSEGVQLGAGKDAKLTYDGTDVILTPADVGTGDVRVNGGSIILQDSEGVIFGTGSDAKITYDGSNLIVTPADVGTGNVHVTGGGIVILGDSESLTLGAGSDATILYDGTDLVINPKAVGAGVLRVSGDVELADNDLYGSAASHTADTADGTLYLRSTTHITKGWVALPNGELGLIIGSDGSVDRATAVGDNALHMFNGAAAPSGTLTNGVTFYSEGGEAKVLDAAGNSTTLSPHTDDGDYVIHSYSARKNETVTIHVEKLLKALAGTPALQRFVQVAPGLVRRPVAA